MRSNSTSASKAAGLSGFRRSLSAALIVIVGLGVLPASATGTADGENPENSTLPAAAWSATLTVDSRTSDGSVYTGYSTWGQDLGSLTTESFALNGRSYRVLTVLTDADDLYLNVSRRLPGDFTLSIGDLEFASSASTEPSTPAAGRYMWEVGDLAWSAGDTPEVSITMVPSDTPLSASFEAVPANHRGSDAFWIELVFTDDVVLSYRTVRDHVVHATNATVKKAKRVTAGSDRQWRIKVKPDSAADVQLDVNATTDCEAVGAVCTGDGRMLQGPAAALQVTYLPVPAAPSNLDTTPGDSLVTLNWDDPGNTSIDGYQSRVSCDGGTTWNPDWADVLQSDATTTEHAVTGLSNGTQCSFEVRAQNSSGTGAAASAAATPIVPAAAPADPDPVSIEADFEASTLTVSEGSYTRVTVTLSGSLENRVAIPLTVLEQNGASSGDYSLSSTSLTFKPGVTSKSVDFIAIPDDDTDDGEVVQVGFGTMPTGVVAGATSTASISITDAALPVSHVTNLDQTTHHVFSLRSYERAQGFLTGSAAAGYVINSVEIEFDVLPGGISNKHFQVLLWPAHQSSNRPARATGSQIAEFANPADLSTGSAGNRSFTAPTGTVLEPNTRYFIMIRSSKGTIPKHTMTNSGNDTSSLGWTIDYGQHSRDVRSGDTWDSQHTSLKLNINGHAN